MERNQRVSNVLLEIDLSSYGVTNSEGVDVSVYGRQAVMMTVRGYQGATGSHGFKITCN